MAITELGDPYERRRLELQEQLAAAEDGRVRLEGDKEVPAEVLDEFKAKLRERLAELPPPPAANVWPGLRRQLETAALVEAEDVPGVAVPFLRFHPTLAPMLWAQVDVAERERLSTAHRRRYYALSGYLYDEDDRNPHQARAIAWRELPNLLDAVHAALDAADPDAVNFAVYVNLFLGNFGLKQEAERLTARAQEAAGEAGSKAWFLAQSNRGEQLFHGGQVAEAAQVFQAILQHLGDAPTYDRAQTLGFLGRCYHAGGQLDLAEKSHRDAMAVWDKLKQTDLVKRERSVGLTDLANVLGDLGKYAEARQAYLGGLKVSEELKDLRQQGVTLGQLGTLAMREGNLEEAGTRFRTALTLFQQLREPAMEAVYWHQLGRVFEEAHQWDEAERRYRESARIREESGIISGPNGAAATWNQLAVVSEMAGKPDAAERWYRKAIGGFRAGNDTPNLCKVLANLARLLHTQPGRLAEARQLAEEALATDRTLDPGAAQIWTTYELLAKIAEKEAEDASETSRKAELQAQATESRRLAREARRNFAGTRHQLKRYLPVILGTIKAVQDRQHRQQLEQILPDTEEDGWTNLVATIRRILDGEREADTLCGNLDPEDSMIIETILAGLADPSALSDLLPSESED